MYGDLQIYHQRQSKFYRNPKGYLERNEKKIIFVQVIFSKVTIILQKKTSEL